MQEDLEHFTERPEERNGDERPQVLALNRKGSRWVLSRRELIAGGGAAGALGCKPEPKETKDAAGAADPQSRCLNTLAHRSAVIGLQVSGDGKTLASFDEAGWVKVWSFPEGGLIRSFLVTDVTTVALQQNGMRLSAGTARGKLLVYPLGAAGAGPRFDAEFVAPPVSLDSHQGPISAVAFGLNDRSLLSAGRTDGRLTLRTPDDLRLLRAVTAHRGGVTTMAVSKDKSQFATAHQQGVVKLWVYRTMQRVRDLRVADPASSKIRTMCFSPDGKTLAAADEHNTTVWDLNTGQLAHTFPGGHFLAFSPDGESLATGQPEVNLYSAKQGQLLRSLERNPDPINAVVFTPDSRQVVTAHRKGGIRIWDTASGNLADCFMDLTADPLAEGAQFTGVDGHGRTVTFTLPCGSRLPPGAICVCNCVSGTSKPKTRPGSTRTYYYPT